MKLLPKSGVAGFIKELSKTREVVAPVSDGESYAVFKSVAPGETPIIDGSRFILSPRSWFMPGYEVLFETKDGEIVDKTPETKAYATIGLYLADAHALEVFDRVFLDGDKPDPYYNARRADNAIFALVPAKKRWSVFWGMTGNVCDWKKACDVVMYDLGSEFVMEPMTDRGAELTKSLADADDGKKAAADALLARYDEGEVDVKAIGERLMWDNPKWEEVSRKCVACGVCTYGCPSCSCFDMRDDLKCGGAERYRCLDSCQHADFTLMGSGYNPRPGRMPRTRQRLLHTFKYQPEQFGMIGCVGCGRCVELCPVGIDIRKIVGGKETK